MTNDNFRGCCGQNSTLNIGETIYCNACDQVAEIVGGEWTDGTPIQIDADGMVTI